MSNAQRKPLILITNDDGIQAKGIQALARAMAPHGRVVVVAPDRAQSGMGHAVTINGILKMEQVTFGVPEVEAAWQTTGTPVDCVKLAIYEILGQKPDLLLSGINHGSNASINVIYSGTMSAAVEGAVEGIPSIGFSLLNHAPDADFAACASYVEQLSLEVLNRSLPLGTCLNVNFPDLPTEELKGLKICRQSAGYWEDAFDKRTSPGGTPYYWMTGKFTNPDQGQDTDEWALRNGYVSAVPTQFDLTAHHAISTLNQWNL